MSRSCRSPFLSAFSFSFFVLPRQTAAELNAAAVAPLSGCSSSATKSESSAFGRIELGLHVSLEVDAECVAEVDALSTQQRVFLLGQAVDKLVGVGLADLAHVALQHVEQFDSLLALGRLRVLIDDMVDDFAAAVGQPTLKALGHIVAARVISLVRVHVEKAPLGVETALVKLVARKFRVTGQALKLNYASEELPEEVAPGDLLSAQTQYKFIQLEGFVSHVRGQKFTVSIDEGLTALAQLPPPLARREESGAVRAPLQHVLRILE
eukprot:CAMPEP_0185573474 /NCGR_PEP_ID=MMETSP0434-20130131/5169_1 /TAXON_ID=626734 ORGANISM="Favella taraikaensis, Strain Fe Narragansett Bay" /NCGR_SAMPLE_ID=MMETSP0434 /ASSEMBLY_ACC=CAM_ASM_000379 /LENGTH=265 /DNA_ID=CAMNT_0028189705 /DNA_START=810 /DNA_END=1606 /DNA_ORIENTATION=-